MLRTISNLIFSHFVVATTDGTIFASARDKDNKVHNFLITRYGDVKEQVRSSFEPVSGEVAERIRQRAQSYYSVIPVYKTRSIKFA